MCVHTTPANRARMRLYRDRYLPPLRALVLHRRRRDLRGRQPPCGTLSFMRIFMMRSPVSSRIFLKSGLRIEMAGPVSEHDLADAEAARLGEGVGDDLLRRELRRALRLLEPRAAASRLSELLVLRVRDRDQRVVPRVLDGDDAAQQSLALAALERPHRATLGVPLHARLARRLDAGQTAAAARKRGCDGTPDAGAGAARSESARGESDDVATPLRKRLCGCSSRVADARSPQHIGGSGATRGRCTDGHVAVY